jgi:hypothetical protein
MMQNKRSLEADSTIPMKKFKEDTEEDFEVVEDFVLPQVPVICPFQNEALFLERDIIETMQEDEKRYKRLPLETTSKPFNVYLQHYRKELVTWMIEIAEQESLSLVTTSYSVSFVDRIVYLVPEIAKGSLQLLGVTCIYIAAKREEVDALVPRLSKLISFCPTGYSKQHIISTESFVLNALQWNLSCIAASHFLDYFISRGDYSPNDLKRLRQYANLFAELCLREYRTERFIPSIVASSCVLHINDLFKESK